MAAVGSSGPRRWRKRAEPASYSANGAAAGEEVVATPSGYPPSVAGTGSASTGGRRWVARGTTAVERQPPAAPATAEAGGVWYFGFGANINPWKLREKRRIIPIEQVPGRLPGWRLVFNHKGGMGNIEVLCANHDHSGGSSSVGPDSVHGILLRLKPTDFERLAQMEYEYETTEVVVEAYDERRVTALAFVSPSAYKLATYPAPPDRYINLIREGAREMQLDAAYQAWLSSVPSIKGQRGDAYWDVPATRKAARRAEVADELPLSHGPLRLRALAEFGADTPLVDIGANLGKCSEQDLAQQLVRAAATHVDYIVLTGCSVKGSSDARRIAKEWGGVAGLARARKPLGVVSQRELDDIGMRSLPTLAFTAGVHPHDAKTCNDNTLGALRELASDPLCVAIGECGLDYDRMFTPRQVQLYWCRKQVELAVELDMPLFLHERDRDASKGPRLGSFLDLLGILEECGPKPSKVCIHCYTGPKEDLQEYVSRGFYIGMTGFVGMQKRGAHIRQMLTEGLLPVEQLMLETDSPFMMPDKGYIPADIDVQGRKNEPCVMPAVCRAAAECLGRAPAEIAAVTTASARRFFAL